jgi:hypothetical protein
MRLLYNLSRALGGGMKSFWEVGQWERREEEEARKFLCVW